MEDRICTRCIIDTTVPGAKFDEKGECSYCKLHDRLEKQYPLDEKGKEIFRQLVKKIKVKGKNKKYDCVVGLSGGRDSTYTLWLLKQLGLRLLAVHFDDGFGNPVAGENIKKATAKLNIELRIVKSDWNESRDIKIAFLKASTIDIEEGTDVGIGTALYGIATKENIKYIISGYSFRTEGICPLPWCYLDGNYLKSVHKSFGSVKLSKWEPSEPGFNLCLHHILYYTFIKGIVVVPILNYVNYVRKEAEEIIKKQLGWVYPGSKYYDDLYQSLLTYVFRVKFKIDRRKFIYSALIRSGQMVREEAINEVKEVDIIEDPKVIDLCIRRLGITREEFDKYLAQSPKTFRDFSTSYKYIKAMKVPIKILSKLNILPGVIYDKYFECG